MEYHFLVAFCFAGEAFCFLHTLCSSVEELGFVQIVLHAPPLEHSQHLLCWRTLALGVKKSHVKHGQLDSWREPELELMPVLGF